ncbi:hypothetical protein [Caldalkalibacillus salinus]|uniref:hypothetical protein n=1 Tax=Caldalkalibacillus salinus TaxID=2803787 RepID=UPI0019230928|nr:hypothetical protein [Caldalkalibacillus salinus]
MQVKPKLIFLIFIFLTCGITQACAYSVHQSENEKPVKNIFESGQYTIDQKEKENIELFIDPEWIPLSSVDSHKLDVQVAEFHNTSFLLHKVINREHDILFIFHTTYMLDSEEGTFLYNKIFNNDGTYTSTGANGQFILRDPQGEIIETGQTGFNSDFSFAFGIQSSEFEKLKEGFSVGYSGMILYEYSLK